MALDLEEAAEEMHRLSTLLDAALDVLRRSAREYADAEQAYRKAKAEAWVVVPRRGPDGEKLTVPEREADVNGRTADLRRTRDFAEGMSKAALEAVRARRGQISALQSLLAAERAEMGMAKYGPD